MTNSAQTKTALVTGGTRGIGKAIAEALLTRGYNVMICGTNQAGIERTLGSMKASYGDRVTGRVCDVRSYEQVHAMMLEIDQRSLGLDVLINNAGIGNFSSVENMEPETWRATIDTNLTGLFNCCHDAIPRMKKRGGGYIVNIGSLAGRNFFPGGAAYGASKAGLIAFSESLMQEVRHDHIRVSYIMPGSVETEFAGTEPVTPSKSWKILPEDVAETVINLLTSNPRSLSSRVEMRPSEPKKQ